MNEKLHRNLLRIAGGFGLAGVAIGAFGAHVLKEKLDGASYELIQTGVLYLFVHTLATLAIAILGFRDPVSRTLKVAGVLMCIGVILFSGFLFWLGLRPLIEMNALWIAFLTPVGGVCFLGGWSFLLAYAFRP